MKQYVTAAELAQHLRCSVWSLYQLVREGRIPTIRLRPGATCASTLKPLRQRCRPT
jgi:hypothetical protein